MKTIGIIGAGPGGYVAAIRAAQLGARVYLIEADKLGGTCLNRGCIPTKTYFRNAEIMNSLKKSEEFGIKVASYSLDGKKLQERKNKIVADLVVGIEKLIASYKTIELIKGYGYLKDKNTIIVNIEDEESREIVVDNIIISTGALPKVTETKGVDLEGVINSSQLLDMDEIPESLVVIGGGVIGLEFASIYRELGSDVTLLASRILKDMDKEVSKKMVFYLKRQGINTHVNTRAKEIIREADNLKVVAEDKKTKEKFEVSGKYILMASGRSPHTDCLNLEDLNIKFDENGIEVDENLETNVGGIYAIGDVNNRGIQLAHVASSEAIHVAERIMGLDSNINLKVYPNCIFTFPEIAYVGYMEDELKKLEIPYKSSKFLLAANGKAMCLGETEGFVKVLSSEGDNKILGVLIYGAHANDLIHEGALAISNELGVESIEKTIHGHPTLSESFMEAVHGLDNKAIHMVGRKKKKTI